MVHVVYISVRKGLRLPERLPRDKMDASDNRSTDKTPLHLALPKANRFLKGPEEGRFSAKEYDSILKESEAIINVPQKYAPPWRPPWNQRIPSKIYEISPTKFTK
jgi:hypothetical protein